MLTLMHPELEIAPARYHVDQTVYVGPRAAQQMWADTLESWADPYWHLERLHEADPHYVVIGRLHVRGRESGAEVDIQGAWNFTIKDGQVYRVVFYLDTEAALAAVRDSDASPAA